MLRDDVAEQRPAERVRLALERAEQVMAAIRVLRRVGDEAALGQFGGEALVVLVPFRAGAANRVHRDSLESVLTDDDRPFLTRLQISRQQQDARRDHVGVDIQDHFVAGVLFLIEHLPRARVQRHRRLGELADQFLIDLVAQDIGRRHPLLDARPIRRGPVLIADSEAFAKEFLRELGQLAHLPLLAVLG